MKLKLNSSEMQSMTSVLDAAVKKYSKVLDDMNRSDKKNALVPFGKGKTIDDGEVMEVRLFRSIFEELWVKFTKKSFEVQKSYSLELKPHQAIAIHLEFNGVVDLKSYEGNLIQKICNNIHQQIQNPD
jgi:hypothetical protein